MFLPELKSRPNEDICLLIKLDNHSQNYLCDCGQATDLNVKDAQDAKAIFISHGHIDHLIDFDRILRYQLETQKEVIICGPLGIAKQIHSKINGYTWNLIKKGSIKYQIREIISQNTIQIYETEPPEWKLKKMRQIKGRSIFENERFKVYFIILDHKTSSIAYLFQEEPTLVIDLKKSDFKPGAWIRKLKTAYEKGKDNQVIRAENQSFKAKDLFHLLTLKKGDSLGFIMDHAASESNHKKIKALFADCNKVFIESFYKESDKSFAKLNYHSYSQKSAEVMRKAGVKEAIPVHFSRKYEEADIRKLMEEFEAAFNKEKNKRRS